MHRVEASGDRTAVDVEARSGPALTRIAVLAAGVSAVLTAGSASGGSPPRQRETESLSRSAAAAQPLDRGVHASSAAGENDTYLDAVGDNEGGLAPDITVTTITSTATGDIAIDVDIPDEPDLLSETDFDVFLDSDRNPATGSVTGSEYAISIDGETQTFAVFHWSDGTWAASPAPSAQIAWRSGPAIRINRRDLGGTSAFHFWQAATRTSLALGGDYSDFAPDVGTWTYVVTPPPVDVTAPNTRITAAPGRRTAAHRATFRFASTEADSNFRCKLDRRPWRRCTAPKRYRNLRLGLHTFRVEARDRAGNVDPTPAVRRWRIRRPVRTT